MKMGPGSARAMLRAFPQAKPSSTLASYVTPLSIPPVIRPKASSGPNNPIEVRLVPFKHKAHRDLPPATIWGYNGMWPGPTFEVRRGEPLFVKWLNHLPTTHFLPVDTTIHGAGEGVPEVRTVTHVHGAQVWPDSDGYPDAWVTSDGKAGSVAAADPCHYPNDQAATTLWYHDHALGITRLNVYAGLAGFYLIRDDEEDTLNLPSGPYEIPLMIQDRKFGVDGSLLYPPPQNGTHPMWMQEFFGDTICVNGKAAPFFEVEPRKYRFRLVNGSNSRFYHLGLVPAVRIAQHALGFQDANVDGDMGPMTVAAINAADPTSLLAGVVGLLTTHYKLLEAQNPKLVAFDHGWMVRANKLPPADSSSGASSTTA